MPPVDRTGLWRAVTALWYTHPTMHPAGPPDSVREDRRFLLYNAGISVGALALLAWLILRAKDPSRAADAGFLRGMNASFNALAATLLIGGVLAIRRGARALHKRLMTGAFASSALFLVGYLTYHALHGDMKHPGSGWSRGIYLFVLATHVLLSATVLPMALTTLFFAWRQRFAAHKRIARILFPVWLYVSVTGVAIYFMLNAARAGLG